ncbi:hypothetical protein ACIBKY_03250 [Nonomuraea sp. NPDC050394]|uniref:hypothetical protein n=1 Tax=Nonomuraea sp. NPDC050394 TaxID=3364363 RepID=UPI0037AF9FED
MDALWWIGLLCVPASIIRRAIFDGQRQHPTPSACWNDRPTTPNPATWTRRALRVIYHIARALGWAGLLLLWIATGLTLAALELGGAACKGLAYTAAGLSMVLLYLAQHAKRLMAGPAPVAAPQLTI